MANKTTKPIFVYETSHGHKALHWPSEYKMGDKQEILKLLKRMAQLAEKSGLAKDIALFEEWQEDPEFGGKK